MNLEPKLNPITGKALTGLNASLPSASKLPELYLSPRGAGGAKDSTCLFKPSRFDLDMAYMGNTGASLKPACLLLPWISKRQHLQNRHNSVLLSQWNAAAGPWAAISAALEMLCAGKTIPWW